MEYNNSSLHSPIHTQKKQRNKGQTFYERRWDGEKERGESTKIFIAHESWLLPGKTGLLRSLSLLCLCTHPFSFFACLKGIPPCPDFPSSPRFLSPFPSIFIYIYMFSSISSCLYSLGAPSFALIVYDRQLKKWTHDSTTTS